MLYRIKDWDRHFETADSRKRETLSWTAIPTKLTGAGYGRITKHPRACEILAAFQAMVKVAATARRPRDGAIADRNGPLTADDLHYITGLPAAAFTIAFEVLVQPRIEWLEIVSEVKTAESAEPPAEVAEVSADVGRPRQITGTTQTVTKTETVSSIPRARAKAAGIELPADPAEQVRVLLGAVMVGSHSFAWGVGVQGPSAQATVAHMVETAGGDVDPVVLELHGLYKLGPPGKSFKAATYISELLHWREKRQEEKPKGSAPETFDRKRYADLAR